MGLTCFECLERRHGISLDPIRIPRYLRFWMYFPVIQTEKLVFFPWFWAKDLPNLTCRRTWIRWWTPWPISSICSGSAPWNSRREMTLENEHIEHIPWKLMLGRWIFLKHFQRSLFLRTSWFFGGGLQTLRKVLHVFCCLPRVFVFNTPLTQFSLQWKNVSKIDVTTCSMQAGLKSWKYY